MSCEYYEDAVAAYDRLAPFYAIYSKKREAYLRGVERLIAAQSRGAHSLLDLGAGNGTRALRIAAAAGIDTVILLEPSSRMAESRSNSTELWQMRAEDLRSENVIQRFDVITCLWNVLGHVPAIGRERVLRTCEQLLSPTGRIFLDLNHRYNARSYGWTATCARWLRDVFLRDTRAGDVTATWKIGETQISTYGHVFTHRELAALVGAAGLEIEERIVIDYNDGYVRRLPWLGNLLYVLRCRSRIESSSAPATS